MFENGQAVTGGFFVISHDQVFARECGRVPGLFFQGGKMRQLARFAGVGIEQNYIAGLGHYQQQVANENFLAVAIAAFFPFELARGRVQANHDTVIQTVNESIAIKQVREF